jgi:uncharacterized membrane protein
MRRMSPVSWILVAVAIVFLAIGIVYLTVAAPDLPSFFPGHVDHAFKAEHYNKRAVASFAVAVVALVLAVLARRRA